jgi:DNA-binding MarR family transcriptional regulator
MGKKVDPQKSAGFLVGRVAHSLKLRIQEFLDDADIAMSAEEVSILTALAHLDVPERMKSLAEMLGRDATTLSRQIAGLEAAGLVQRSPCPDDGRAFVVTVTKAGTKVVEQTMPMSLALRSRAMKGISKADANAMVRALSQMLKNLNED